MRAHQQHQCHTATATAATATLATATPTAATSNYKRCTHSNPRQPKPIPIRISASNF